MGDLDGKTAIVTGAAGNIGLVTSRRLAEAGANVVMADLADDAVRAAAGGLSDDGLSVLPVAADISTEVGVLDLVEQAVGAFKGIDIIDNNAAGTAFAQDDHDVLTMDLSAWDAMFAVNVTGPMLLCKHAIPSMIERGGGSIINISSGTSLAGNDQTTAYACSKGALNTLTKYVATQYASKGLRCNALALGIVLPEAMDFGGEALPADNPMNAVFEHHIVGRFGRPADVAEVVLFLASDRSAFITGQVVSVDGGFFAHLPSFRASD
jgi:NAD(P)-dependent dehydrogenase (short-subunit alcohol dehydrogenase family)